MNCKLCNCNHCIELEAAGKRHFFFCPGCQLISVPSEEHLSFEEEKKRYALHDNSANNPVYVAYLESFSHEIDRIPLKQPRILDFGAGFDYVLTRVLRARGFSCEPYDPLYDLGNENLSFEYDVVVLCETIEHLRDLEKEIQKFTTICKPNGYLLIRTQLYRDRHLVPGWWYAADPTHINFFNLHSLKMLANLKKRKIYFSNDTDIVVIGPQGDREQ